MDANLKRGSAELAILATLAEEPLHGYELARRIEARSGGTLRFTLASLYPMLYRLESRKLLAATWQTTSGGRRRRYYRLTTAGRKKLAPLRREWSAFFDALNRLAGVSGA